MITDKMIAIDDIDASDRLRPVDVDWAQAIAATYKDDKLDTPISIRAVGEGYRLIYGAHRLEALRLLGVMHLREGDHYKLLDLDDAGARLAEIDENLMRHELSAVDKAIFLAERKKVWDQINAATKRGGDRKSQVARELEIKRTKCPFDFPVTFTKDAAAKTGLTDRTIRRAVALADMLTPELLQGLRGTALANIGQFCLDEKPHPPPAAVPPPLQGRD